MPGKHLPLTLPVSFAGLGAVYYGISMMSIANGNATTALAIAANVDFLHAIAAMSLRAAPAIIPAFVFYAIYRYIDHYSGSGFEAVAAKVLMSTATLITLFYTSILFLGVIALIALLHLIHVISRKGKWRRKFDSLRLRSELAGTIMLTFVFSFMIWGPSWLPYESAKIAGTQRTISVIKETDELIYYLDKESDRVIYGKPSDLTERAFCTYWEIDTIQSTVKLIQSGRTYPECPDK